MKKFLTISVLVFFITGNMNAQSTLYEKPVKRTQTLKTTSDPAPAPAPAPAPTQVNNVQKTAPNLPIYRITSARIHILTGNDNKEFPSKVSFSLYQKNYDESKGDRWEDFGLFEVRQLKNEMKINSNTEMGLGPINNGNTSKNYLSNIQNSGLVFEIIYDPNFFADAWRIEGISLTLEVKDQNGNYHPTLGSKTINFQNATGFLNGEYRRMVCSIDGSLNGITASIEKCPDCFLLWKKRL